MLVKTDVKRSNGSSAERYDCSVKKAPTRTRRAVGQRCVSESNGISTTRARTQTQVVIIVIRIIFLLSVYIFPPSISRPSSGLIDALP